MCSPTRPPLRRAHTRQNEQHSSSTSGRPCRAMQHRLAALDWQKQAAGHCQKDEKNYSMMYSRVVSHRSTDITITSLTSGIRRDPVLSGVYGRS